MCWYALLIRLGSPKDEGRDFHRADPDQAMDQVHAYHARLVVRQSNRAGDNRTVRVLPNIGQHSDENFSITSTGIWSFVGSLIEFLQMGGGCGPDLTRLKNGADWAILYFPDASG
jgi:hypothetical protein